MEFLRQDKYDHNFQFSCSCCNRVSITDPLGNLTHHERPIRAVNERAGDSLKRSAPAKVKEYSQRYFEEQDRLAGFIRERCRVGDGLRVQTATFLSEYNAWVGPSVFVFGAVRCIDASPQTKNTETENHRLTPVWTWWTPDFHSL